MRRRSIIALFVLTLASAGIFVIPFQRAAASPSQDQAIHVGVPLVNVYATVLDKKNALVPNLNQADFRIFEDKVEQKISFFSREHTLPLSIGVILDTSTSEEHNLETAKKSASEFLHRALRPGDRAFVVAFDVGANLLSNWTRNLTILDSGIQRALIGIGYNNNVKDGQFVPAGSHLWDVIYASCLNKMAAETGRKTLIVITDSHDEGSDKSVIDAIEAAQRSDTLIQMLIVRSDRVMSGDLSPDVAKRIATETGGSTINITNQFGLQNAFDKISNELRTEYSLGYYPTNAKPDGKFRHLKVEMTNKDYKARAREGYFARTTGK